MHRSYVPTRLIEWTADIRVALFCALARELHAPAIFVLDPRSLNRLNGVDEIPNAVLLDLANRDVMKWPMALPEEPLAIESRSAQSKPSIAQYTVHGSSRKPLEDQCQDCVKKIVLTREECLTAVELVLTDIQQ